MINTKEQKRVFRHKRICKKVQGTSQVPRMCIHRSLKNMSVSLIDDVARKTLIGMSTAHKDIKNKLKTCGNIQGATSLGGAFAIKAQEKGIKKVCFDRGGYLYHGRVKAFAEAARKGGLEF